MNTATNKKGYIGYMGYLRARVEAQQCHMRYLETQLQHAKSDQLSGWIVAIGFALIALAMWCNWPEVG